MAFSGDENSITPGCEWLLCNGRQVSSLQYPELYAVVGEKYAPENIKSFLIERNSAAMLEKTFYLPDLRGRVIVGVDYGTGRITSNNILGATGGTESVILTVDQLAEHHHSLPAPRGIGNGVTCNIGGSYTSSSLITAPSGGNQPHNNMQPYMCLNYIINTGKMNNPAAPNMQIERINQLEQEIRELKIAQRGCAKAWVVFDGAANILESYGVSSITIHSIGDYTINFSTPFNSANYCSVLNASMEPKGVDTGAITAYGPYKTSQTQNNFRLKVMDFRGNLIPHASVSACFYSS